MPLYVNENQIGKYLNALSYQAGFVAWKDKHGVYLGANPSLVKYVGFRDEKELTGKTDYELRCKASELAPQFQKIDQESIALQKEHKQLCFTEYQDRWRLMLASHTIVLNTIQQAIAIIVSSQDITNIPILTMGVSLNKALQKKMLNKQNFTTLLVDRYEKLNLTKQQSRIFFYFINGYCNKEIGKILSLSPRTIEGHLENIKINLNCTKRSELFDLAISSGLLEQAIIQVE